MSELKLGTYDERPYGQIARGAVEIGRSAVHVTVREPARNAPRSGATYVIIPGWTEEKRLLGPGARLAAQLGHTAVTLSFTNRWSVCGTAAKNAGDISAVLDAMPKTEWLIGIGHSGGSSWGIRGAKNSDSDICLFTGVASAELIPSEGRTLKKTARRLLNVSHEPTAPSKELAKEIDDATIRHIARRLPAVSGEAGSLLFHDIYPELLELEESRPGLQLRFGFGENDTLFPYEEIRPTFDKLGWSKKMFTYEGDHCTFLKDGGALAATIFEMDAELLDITLPRKDQFTLAA